MRQLSVRHGVILLDGETIAVIMPHVISANLAVLEDAISIANSIDDARQALSSLKRTLEDATSACEDATSCIERP